MTGINVPRNTHRVTQSVDEVMARIDLAAQMGRLFIELTESTESSPVFIAWRQIIAFWPVEEATA